MARITKTQTYAIMWLNSQNFEPIKIADELKLNLKQVATVLEKQSHPTKNSNIETKSSPVNKQKNLMINETAIKKTNSVAIMTKEASARNDELQKNIDSSSVRRSYNSIYRPNS